LTRIGNNLIHARFLGSHSGGLLQREYEGPAIFQSFGNCLPFGAAFHWGNLEYLLAFMALCNLIAYLTKYVYKKRIFLSIKWALLTF